jgi:Na+-transporting NADH:ubiquinone oxidoreductase subunit A
MKRAVASLGSRRAGAPVGVPVRIDEGVDIPLAGEPEQVVSDAAEVRSVALVGTDYIGLRPLMKVEEGDRVKLGQALFADRSNPEILFTSPGSGIVRRINRGPRRALHSVVVDLAGDEEETFGAFGVDQPAGLGRDRIAARLLASGLWTALRRRPFGRVADPRTMPRSIFITATDSNPLEARPELVIARPRDDFLHGLTVVAGLTEGPTFLCQAPGVETPTGGPASVETVEFSGPHPSGLVGTHIHFLDPVSAERTVWTVALAGPGVERPRLISSRLGASIDELTHGELREGHHRVISGSILSGRQAAGPLAFLGRFHNQISVIAEAAPRADRGWFVPRRAKAFSTYRLGLPSGQSRYAMTTALHGQPCAMFPLGGFERVMPLDILATPLLKALLVEDHAMSQALGCLELDEEDLALCTFVCPSKFDYGALLRTCLTAIETQG